MTMRNDSALSGARTMGASEHTVDVAHGRLANGLAYASVRLPGFRTACIGAYVRVGSRYEPPALAGVSHFFEHMAFKGTDRRDAYRIAVDAERAGAYMNAFTAKDHTGYYLHLPGEQGETAVELIADVLRHSVFPPEELERERHVVLQEMMEAEDDAEGIAQDEMDQAAFPRHSLGQPILGKKSVIRTIRRRDFMSYLRRHYSAPNIALVGAGSVDHAAFRRYADKYFGDLPPATVNRTEHATYRGGYRHRALDFGQTWLALGWPTLGRGAAHYPLYELLAELLGGGTASPLFQSLRERNGLAYAVSATIEGFEECGILQITAGVAPRNVSRALALVAEVLARPIDPDDFERARNQVRAHHLARLERPQSLAEAVGIALLTHGDVNALETRRLLLETVPLAEVESLRRHLLAIPPALAIVGRAGRADHYERLCKRLGVR